jgi:hypothetical protein
MAMMSRDADLRVAPPEGFSVHVVEGQRMLSSKRTEFILRDSQKPGALQEAEECLAKGGDGEIIGDCLTRGAPGVQRSRLHSPSAPCRPPLVNSGLMTPDQLFERGRIAGLRPKDKSLILGISDGILGEGIVRHVAAGIQSPLTQRSLVQIQPPQPATTRG